MYMPRRLSWKLGFASIAIGALAAAPAPAGENPHTAKPSKKAGGPYEFGQPNLRIEPGKSKSVYFQIADSDSSKDVVRITGGFLDGDGFQVKWFKGKKQKQNITAQVAGDGLPVAVPADKARYLNARIKNTGDGGEDCIGIGAESEDMSFIAYSSARINNASCVGR